MRVSIVIPVYNEEDWLAECLKAIGRQTTKPYEVIVVDNNSTDNTHAVARQFPFVTVINEPRQGVIYARNRGFDAANGDIIGRIDADTVIDKHWVRTVRQLFVDPDLDAVSGAVSYYDSPNPPLSLKCDLFFRRRIARGMGNEVFLYGANMAMRRTAWQVIRSQTCLKAGMHEDFDLAIHSHQVGAKVRFDERLLAGVSLRRFNSSFSDFWLYAWLSPRTYAQHKLRSQWHMYPVIYIVLGCYLPFKLMHRGYDPEQNSFSWLRVFTPRATRRVNPATFVD